MQRVTVTIHTDSNGHNKAPGYEIAGLHINPILDWDTRKQCYVVDRNLWTVTVFQRRLGDFHSIVDAAKAAREIAPFFEGMWNYEQARTMPLEKIQECRDILAKYYGELLPRPAPLQPGETRCSLCRVVVAKDDTITGYCPTCGEMEYGRLYAHEL